MINFVLIAIFLSLGAIAKRQAWLPDNASIRLNQFVIFICLPAIVLSKIPKLAIDSNLLLPIVIPWSLALVAAILVIALSKMKGWSAGLTGAVLMLVCFGNTSFFGFPMVRAFYGEAGLPFAVVYDILGSFLSLALIGNAVIAVYSSDGAFNFKAVLIKFATFPPFIAIVFSFLIQGWLFPTWLQTGLETIGLLLVPSTMFLLGVHLTFSIDKAHRQPLLIALSLKLLLLPAVALIGVVLLLEPAVTNNLLVKVSLFEAAMPPMVTASVMAIHARMEPKLVATSVGVGLVVSCVSLPLWYWVVGLLLA